MPEFFDEARNKMGVIRSGNRPPRRQTLGNKGSKGNIAPAVGTRRPERPGGAVDLRAKTARGRAGRLAAIMGGQRQNVIRAGKPSGQISPRMQKSIDYMKGLQGRVQSGEITKEQAQQEAINRRGTMPGWGSSTTPQREIIQPERAGRRGRGRIRPAEQERYDREREDAMRTLQQSRMIGTPDPTRIVADMPAPPEHVQIPDLARPPGVPDMPMNEFNPRQFAPGMMRGGMTQVQPFTPPPRPEFMRPPEMGGAGIQPPPETGIPNVPMNVSQQIPPQSPYGAPPVGGGGIWNWARNQRRGNYGY